MRPVIFVILTCGCLAYAADTAPDIDLTPVKPFTLSVEQWHSLTNDRLKQTVDVAEGESFRVVATVNGIRWTTKGVVGQIKGNSIPVDLTTEWFENEQNNERSSKRRFLLKLTGEKQHGPGHIHGVGITSSIQRNAIR